MGELKALRQADISPEIVVQSLIKELPKLRELYVVALTDDDPIVWATGNLNDLCYAAKCLDVMADRYIRGEIESEK
jgi:hypothetical protein